MTSRKRLNKLAASKDFTEKMRVAEDSYPGTDFDGLFRDLTVSWIELHHDAPAAEKLIRNPAIRKLAKRQLDMTRMLATIGERLKLSTREEDAGMRRKARGDFFQWVGECIADLCVRGESKFLRELANALDAWKWHEPKPDAIRQAVLMTADSAKRLGRKFTMRELAKQSNAHGLDIADQNTRRTVRRIAKDMGMPFQGKAGRPKTK